MPVWLIWLIAAGVLAAVETLTLTLVLAMCAGGAAAGAITAAFGGPVWLQFVVAIAAMLALVGGVRPVARRHLATPGGILATGVDALVGKAAVVLEQVDDHHGLIRLNGNQWTARTQDGEEALPAGTPVRVLRIDGATALVIDERPFRVENETAP